MVKFLAKDIILFFWMKINKNLALLIWFIYLIFIFFLIPLFCKKFETLLIPQIILPNYVKLLGIVFIIFGFILGFWCFVVLWKQGEGTPSFLYPPKKLVTTGPYKYSRNPMTVGAWLIFIGESIFLQSPLLFMFFLFVVIPVSIIWIIKYEEPFLEKNFKNTYREYKNIVKKRFI
ncbi:MAG: hypothetical protein C0190_05330 [Thermodesulfobacterium geofontis]|uniref:Isoprenylcysteine carboxylmethyltransferase family protein n=1 Tax=Thermodesulfobacterium geofontis TaxID=1295609 RepID=A0A2N7PMV4_9BACT|nr:MAG: hypothetical protein C0190_05330 [Thermodesulfobacterium geofontis]